MNDKQPNPPTRLSPLAISYILLALNETAHHMPPGIRAKAERLVHEFRLSQLQDNVEAEIISRMLKDRKKNCPVLHSLMARLAQPH